MDGLTIGLAFGLAAGGGVAGLALNFAGDFVAGLGQAFGLPVKNDPAWKTALQGAFAGAVLGLAVGTGIDLLSDDAPAEPNVIEQCVENAPDGKSAVITRDDIGNPVCSYQ